MNRQPFERPPRHWQPRLSPSWIRFWKPLTKRRQLKTQRLGLAVLGYLGLVFHAYWCRPQFAPAPNAVVPFVLGLLVIGLIQHLILRRARRLDEDAAGPPSDRIVERRQ